MLPVGALAMPRPDPAWMKRRPRSPGRQRRGESGGPHCGEELATPNRRPSFRGGVSAVPVPTASSLKRRRQPGAWPLRGLARRLWHRSHLGRRQPMGSDRAEPPPPRAVRSEFHACDYEGLPCSQRTSLRDRITRAGESLSQMKRQRHASGPNAPSPQATAAKDLILQKDRAAAERE